MKILLLTPIMADYYKIITNVINNEGHDVNWYYSGLKKKNDFDELLNRANKKRAKRKYEEYISSITESADCDYDKVILIFGGEYFSESSFDTLKTTFCKAEFIYYNWDSVSNYPNVLSFYNKFDRYYSFDKNDCEKYGFTFLPLFFCNIYIETVPKYDYFWLMTYSKKKYKNYIDVKNSLPKGLNGVEYLVFPNKLKYYISKLLRMKYVNNIDRNVVHFTSLKRDEAYRMFAKSKVIIDTPLEGQNGLTIRTFEALNQKRKLITTNCNIKEYDFYSKDNILVIKEGDRVSESFFSSPFNDEFAISDNYSIKSFVNILLGND